jgi:hypothetical protein
MTKKIVLTIGILAIIALAAFLIFGGEESGQGDSKVGFLREFFPFGSSDEVVFDDGQNQGGGEEKGGGENIGDTNTPVPRVRKISSEPVAGAVVFNVGTTSVVRFVEKGTGNVYEARSDTVKIDRLTNTTIPKIVRAYWLPDGSGFLAQTLMTEYEIIETSFVKVVKNDKPLETEVLTPFVAEISKLPTGIKELSISPDGKRIFYYTSNGFISNWFTSNPDGTKSTSLGSYRLNEWLPLWYAPNSIIMQTKSSALAESYIYELNPSTKALRKVGGSEVGLSSLPSPEGTSILISSGGSFPDLYFVDSKTAVKTSINTRTLADKCAWSRSEKNYVFCGVPTQVPQGVYPDSWYKGLLQTEDYVKKIDVLNNISYDVAYLSNSTGEKIDVVDMAVSKDDSHIIFKNKVDEYLWMLRVAEEY